MKKLIAISSSILLSQLFVCSTYKEVTIYEITNDRNNIIKINTIDSKTYGFSPKGYDDTFYELRGLEIFSEDSFAPFRGKIPIKNIVSIKSKMDNSSSYDFMAAIVPVGIIVLLGISQIPNLKLK